LSARLLLNGTKALARLFHKYYMNSQPIFQDRIDAGLALCQHLHHYKNVDGVTLAVPRGGVPVA
jgi:hypothetical protein